MQYTLWLELLTVKKDSRETVLKTENFVLGNKLFQLGSDHTDHDQWW